MTIYMPEYDFKWVRMDLSHKKSLPQIGEWIMLYIEKEGCCFGQLESFSDRAGRPQYYVYLGNRLGARSGNNRAVKGRKIWWQPAPGVPFGVKS